MHVNAQLCMRSHAFHHDILNDARQPSFFHNILNPVIMLTQLLYIISYYNITSKT